MSNRRKTRLISKQLELPFFDPEVEREKTLTDVEPESPTSVKVVSFCSYKVKKSRFEIADKKEEVLKEITDSAYKLFL